jgi:orotidine-5'-phosphate decarboxylase
MTAQEKLNAKISDGFHICVGLDTDQKKIPEHLNGVDDPILEFNKAIISATKDHAAAYKINFAFYESEGIEGLISLRNTLKYIPSDIMVIADAKRGDIGNTSGKYAESVFDHFHFDSITLHPYMGYDSIEPFIAYDDKINFVLGLTSNPGSKKKKKLKLSNGKFLYQEVISKVKEWNTKSNCGIVFGATNTSELQENIKLFDTLPVLLHGVGAQGGSLEDVVKVFGSIRKRDFLINVSRGLIYIDSSKGFQSSVEKKIIDFNEQIGDLNHLFWK